MTAPRTKHQKISWNLCGLLWSYNKKKQLGELFHAPCDVKFNEIDVVQPDIVFIPNTNLGIIQEKAVEGSPDLLIEILSPSNPDRDKTKKFDLYERYGVKEYWIVDPEKETFEVYTLEAGQYKLFCSGSKAKSKLFSDFTVLFSELL